MRHQERARKVKLKLLRLRQRDNLAGFLKTSQPVAVKTDILDFVLFFGLRS